MNPKFPAELAAKLASNPALFDDMEESLLGDLVFHFHQGELDEEDAAEVSSMIQTNPTAQAIYQRILDAKEYASSPDGEAWLDGMFDRVRSAQQGTSEIVPFPTSRCRVSFASFGIAAEDDDQPLKYKVFDVDGFSESLMIQPHGEGSHAKVIVFDEEYESSAKLDGARLEIGDGSFLIHGGEAVVPLNDTCLEFRLISADGRDLSLRERA